MLAPVLKKNERKARWAIALLSLMVFAGIGILSGIQIDLRPSFDIHVFATINAGINSAVSVLLVVAVVAVRRKKYLLHRNLMYAAIILSCVFFLSYIAHHLLAGDTKYGGEGAMRYIYFFILITHIVLAAIILPFILFTAYRGLTADFGKHKQLARFTFPLWLYVSISGVLVYVLISPYYS